MTALRAGLVLTALLLLAGCHPSRSGTPAPRPSATLSSTPAAAALQRTAVGVTVADPVPGGSFTVVSLVRGYRPTPVVAGPVVLVQIRATAGQRFADGVTAGDFTLTVGSGVSAHPVASLVPAAVLTAAGFPPLPVSALPAGRSATGWLPFVLPAGTDATGLTLHYLRAAFVVTGSLLTVPARSAAVPLPDPS